MIDPRFKEVFDFIDELDGDGNPTTRAKIALKIQDYGYDVDDLKKSLLPLEEEAGELQATVSALSVALEEQSSRKTDLVAEAQDAAVRAAISGSGGGAARLRNLAQATRDRISEFERDFERDTARMAEAQVSLEAKKRAITDQRGNIVRRLNTMSSLAERAGVEFGKEMFAKPSPPQPRSPQMVAPRVVRRRPRRVRVRRRKVS